MSSSSNHFLSLDANKKPTVRKGVGYQSFIPPVLPGAKVPASRAGQLRKVHVAMNIKVNTTLERVSKTLPDMGPFNRIASELATEYFEQQEMAVKDDSEPVSRVSNYWDDLEESLDKMVKNENVEESSSSSSFSLDALRGLLSRLEGWNDRSIRATLGTGQVLSCEVDELLEEARVMGQRVELPSELLTKLRILQRTGEAFASKVSSKLDLRGKEKVPLRVLTDLMKEAEALPIETEEVRFFRNQRGRIQAICHSAQKASRHKSLEKSKEVTVEAAEVRAVLPELDFLKNQVSMGEWVQKATSRTEKKGSVPIQTIEQLLEDPSAALIKAEDCEIMRVLQEAMAEAKAWQAHANRIMAGVPGMDAEGKSITKMPTIEELMVLQEQHANLSKICIPVLTAHIEGVIRRARAWVKKQERTLSGTWSLSDAKSLLEEGRQISTQVDLNPEFGKLAREVTSAELWCDQAKKLISSLSLSDIEQLEPLVSSSFKAPALQDGGSVSDEETSSSSAPASKRARTAAGQDAPGYAARLRLSGKEIQALKNYENALNDLTWTLVRVEVHIAPLLHQPNRLPTQDQLDELKATLGIVRDTNLEDDINQLFEGANKWSDRAEMVLAAPFPRQSGVLRSLASLIHDLAASPMRYRRWQEIVQAAREEVWAHGLRFITLPVHETSLEALIKGCPFPEPEKGEDFFDSGENFEKIRSKEIELSALLSAKQEVWMRQVLGLEVRDDNDDSLLPSEIRLLRQCSSIRNFYVKTCEDLLTPRRSPMHTRSEAEFFLAHISASPLLHLPSVATRVTQGLSKNGSHDAASRKLEERFQADFSQTNSALDATLFHDLLVLLEAVEFAELKVEHFDSVFIPIVGKLLQYQASVRSLFKWDHDERVQEANYRPMLQELEALWTDISGEAETVLKLSQRFIREVAYLASAFQGLETAREWRRIFGSIVAAMKGDALEVSAEFSVAVSQENFNNASSKVSINALKKHVSKWAQLAVLVPYEDILSNADMALIDDWSKALTTAVSGRAKQRRRASLEEAEELLKSAPNPFCVNSADFEILASQVAAARDLRSQSTELILQSFTDRSRIALPVTEVPEIDQFTGELARLVKEGRKSQIQIGTEKLLELELRIRAINRNLSKILIRPFVVPLDVVEPFLNSIAQGVVVGSPDSIDPEENGDSAIVPPLSQVSFQASPALVESVDSKIELSHKWRTVAARFLALLPVHHQTSQLAPVSSASKRAMTTPQGEQTMALNQMEAALNSSLNAPPTAAGEKSLEIILRNLDKEILGDLEIADPALPAVLEYTYPLPLYQLPSSSPSVAAAERASSGGRKKLKNISAGVENPLLLRGLSSMHQLLYQVPWTRAGMGYLSPLNEVMQQKPREWVVGEKNRLREKISKPGLTLAAALDLLLQHKRFALFQTPESVRARSMAAQSLKTMKTCVSRFGFLMPKSVSDGADIPLEAWEKYVQPSSTAHATPTAMEITPTSTLAQQENEETEIVGLLLQLDALAFQVPTKYRLLMLMLDLYDWRVRSQCVCHHMHRDARPRPWAGDERALARWSTTPPPSDIFSSLPVSSAAPPASDPLYLHVIPSPPPADYVLCAMHMSFYYVIESCRHFIRVMSDMCELCFAVTPTDQESVFWISCDACEKWFHGQCANQGQSATSFTCPNCVLANPNAHPEKKRVATALLASIPPPRQNLASETNRRSDVDTLMAEARQQAIVASVNPAELGIFKRLLEKSKQA